MVCKNCGKCKEAHLEGKRKFTDEMVLVCPSRLFDKPTLFEDDVNVALGEGGKR